MERECKARLGAYGKEELVTRQKFLKLEGDEIGWDTQAVLQAMVDNWQGVFRFRLGPVERFYTGELLDVWNKWAREEPFTSGDVCRAPDTAQRLLQAISEGKRAEVVAEMKAEQQRAVFAEQARNKTRYQLQLEGTPQGGA